MQHFLKAFIALALIFTMGFGSAMAQDDVFPYNREGFVDEGEYVYENDEEGVWRYVSPTLRIEILRHHDEANKLVWHEAEIFSKEPERFKMIPKDITRRWKKLDYVPIIAKENGVVFALNSDFAHLRMEGKRTPGIIVRDGQIVVEKTRNRKSTVFPNLDLLALFEDGDMKVFEFDEITGQELIDMGAVDVLAFGPNLVRDGEVNTEDVKKYGIYREPRTAIGMYEKGHYLAIMVEGRTKRSKGINLENLAALFREHGCSLAFNLDGGQSATMVFMGKQIIQAGDGQNAKARSTAEIFAIGYTKSVTQP